MRNFAVKALNELERFFYLLMLGVVLLSACKDRIISPENDQAKRWYGQVISDVFYEVLKPDGTVWTWGNNLTGGLGDGTNKSRETPCQVLRINHIISIDQSFGAAVALDKNGNVWFWGNSMIYLGPADVDTNVTFPITIAHLDGAKSITLDGVHLFLLKNDGSIWYIRLDWYTPTVVEGPRRIEGISTAVSIYKNLALTMDGKIYHMASLECLQDSLRDVIAISGVPERHVIALKRDGTVWGWGENNLGQLGNGTFVDSEAPTQVKNLTDIVEISANYDFNLALKKDRTVWFWGFAGRQGDTLIGLNTPVQIQGLENAVLIYAAANCLTMKDDGTYWTFYYDKRIPTQVPFN